MKIFVSLLLAIATIEAFFTPEYATNRVCDAYIYHNHTITFCYTKYGTLVEGVDTYWFRLEDLPQILFGRNVRDEDVEAASLDLCSKSRLQRFTQSLDDSFFYTYKLDETSNIKIISDLRLTPQFCLKKLQKLKRDIKEMWINYIIRMRDDPWSHEVAAF